MNLPLTLGVMNCEIRSIAPEQLRGVSCFLDALSLCIQVSRVKRTDANLSVEVGIHPAQFSRIRQGKAHLPTDKIPVIERLCGNTAITQWLASQHGASLKFESLEEKVARLEAELAKVAA